MTTGWSATYEYLDGRGAPYGITAEDLIAKAPSIIQNDPRAILSFWQQKDISHIFPTSTHPELAGEVNNWIPEDPGPNHARHDQVMSWAEQCHAQLDNVIDALWPF
jgi:hypothetical protein